MPKKMTEAERKIVLTCALKPRYSGVESLTFWSEVRHPANDRMLYNFACALQDLESRVLAAVNEGVLIRAEKVVLAGRHRSGKPK